MRSILGLALAMSWSGCVGTVGGLDDDMEDPGGEGDRPGRPDGGSARCTPSDLTIVDQNAGTFSVYRHDIAIGPDGSVYSAVSSGQRVFVRVSSDSGATWTQSADVPFGTNPGRVVIDVADRVVYVAVIGDSAGGRRAVLMRSTPPFSSWTMLDQFPATRLFDLHVAGGIFVSGLAPSGAAAEGWFIRGGTDGGAFSTRDHIPNTGISPDDDTRADSLASDEAGNLYATGLVYDGINLVWTVRKSSNGGAAWQTVDGYESIPNAWALGLGIAVADDQSLLVTGEVGERMTDVSYLNRWLIRRSAPGGTGWTTIYRQPAVGGSDIFVGRDIATGDDQRIYAIGYKGVSNTMASQFVFATSNDGGATWTQTSAPFTGPMQTEFVADHVVTAPNGTVYVSRGDAIQATCPD